MSETREKTAGTCTSRGCTDERAADSTYCAPHRDKKRASNAKYLAAKSGGGVARRPGRPKRAEQPGGYGEWTPLIDRIDQRIAAMEAELVKLKQARAAVVSLVPPPPTGSAP